MCEETKCQIEHKYRYLQISDFKLTKAGYTLLGVGYFYSIYIIDQDFCPEIMDFQVKNEINQFKIKASGEC